MALAASRAGLKHLVWSTLEDTRLIAAPASSGMPMRGDYQVSHFDAKGECDKYFLEAGVPATFMLSSFYWENLVNLGAGPQRGEDGSLVFALPMGNSKLPGIAAEDIGRCALGIFKRGNAMVGKRTGIAGEHLTGEEMAQAMSAALGKSVRYVDMDPDAYRALDFPGAQDLGNMYQFMRDFNDEYCAARVVTESGALNPSLLCFADWLSANATRIPA